MAGEATFANPKEAVKFEENLMQNEEKWQSNYLRANKINNDTLATKKEIAESFPDGLKVGDKVYKKTMKRFDKYKKPEPSKS